MMYMVLHAEAVLDLVAVRDREIQFRQVAGSFVTLQGKFILQTDPEVGLISRPFATAHLRTIYALASWFTL